MSNNAHTHIGARSRARNYRSATPRPQQQLAPVTVQKVYPAAPIVALVAVVTSGGFLFGFLAGWQNRENRA